MHQERKAMLFYLLKRQLLYRTPNAVLRGVFRDHKGIYWFAEGIGNKQLRKGKRGRDYCIVYISLLLSVLCFPVILIIDIVQIYLRNKVTLPRVEVCLTTYCSLKCRDCSNLMQHYENPYHIPGKQILSDLQKILDGIDELEQLVLLGGEPFLHPDFMEVVGFAKREEKIKTVLIITNGVFRKEKQELETLADPKIRINVSDYGVRPEQVAGNVALLRELGVNVLCHTEKSWYDMGGLEKRNRSETDLRRQFQACKYRCKCILNGKLFVCPRASHGSELGFFEDPAFVDLRQEDERKRKEEVIRLYYRKDPILTCDYCDAGTDLCKEIPCGIQMK